MNQKREDYHPDKMTKAGYVPLGILRAEDWQKITEIAGKSLPFNRSGGEIL